MLESVVAYSIAVQAAILSEPEQNKCLVNMVSDDSVESDGSDYTIFTKWKVKLNPEGLKSAYKNNQRYLLVMQNCTATAS